MRPISRPQHYFCSNDRNRSVNSVFAWAIFLRDSSMLEWIKSLPTFLLSNSSRLELIASNRIFSSINRSIHSTIWGTGTGITGLSFGVQVGRGSWPSANCRSDGPCPDVCADDAALYKWVTRIGVGEMVCYPLPDASSKPDGQCPHSNFPERDCVRSTSRSAAAGLRHSRAPNKLGRYPPEVALYAAAFSVTVPGCKRCGARRCSKEWERRT